jgi:hypothetical protein
MRKPANEEGLLYNETNICLTNGIFLRNNF